MLVMSTEILIATADPIVTALLATLAELEGLVPVLTEAARLDTESLMKYVGTLLCDARSLESVEPARLTRAGWTLILVGPAAEKDALDEVARASGAHVLVVPSREGTVRDRFRALLRSS